MYHLVLASFFIVIYQSSLVYIGLHTADCIEFINHGNRNVTYVSKNDSVNNVQCGHRIILCCFRISFVTDAVTVYKPCRYDICARGRNLVSNVETYTA